MISVHEVHLKPFGQVLAKWESQQLRFFSHHAQSCYDALSPKEQERICQKLGLEKSQPIILAEPVVVADSVDSCEHDLFSYAREVAQQYFDFQLPISWGRMKNGELRSITFGYYHPKPPRIVINPRLNQPWIPKDVITYVIFHEMLHHICKGHWDRHPVLGRYFRVHTKEFRTREKEFVHYQQSRSFLKKNLRRILGLELNKS